RSLVFAPLVPGSLDAAAALVAEGVRPLSDQHASGPFRLHLAQVLAGRALRRAAGRAGRAAGTGGARGAGGAPRGPAASGSPSGAGRTRRCSPGAAGTPTT